MVSLSHFFDPACIVVVGASDRPGSTGAQVMANLQACGSAVTVFPVNTRPYDSVSGLPCYRRIEDLPAVPDLAVVCVPENQISSVLRSLAQCKTGAVLWITGGGGRGPVTGHPAHDEARALGLTLIGPGSLGLIVPALGINLSVAHICPEPGAVAFVGQSSAMGSALLDWAVGRGVGFSHFITTGSGQGPGIAGIIDYLASDRRVRTILLNVETVPDPRSLMTALRSASRTKRVLAIRNGLHDPVPEALISRDTVDYRYFRRAGVLAVDSLDALFSGLEILTGMKSLPAESLAVVANGLGMAMLAANQLHRLGGTLADDPVVLDCCAGADAYSEVLSELDKRKDVGAVLLIIAPGARDLEELAEKLAEIVRRCRHMVLTCWPGQASTGVASELFSARGLMHFQSPSVAVSAFMTMVHHERNQQSLRETPPALRRRSSVDQAEAGALIAKMQKADRSVLSWVEARQLLEIYHFQLIPSVFFRDQGALVSALHDFPLSLRIVHEAQSMPFFYNRSPSGRWRNVVIGIRDREDLFRAAGYLADGQKQHFPESEILGFSVQPVRRKMDDLVFSFGITRDSVTGPLIVFGEGGAFADIRADRKFGLPPLNANHCQKLISRSHAYDLLKEYSSDLQLDMDELCSALLAVSEIAVNHPEIAELEISALLQPDHSLLVLTVTAGIGKAFPVVIVPYPVHLERSVVLPGAGRMLLRPVRAEDEELLRSFYQSMPAEQLRTRFFGSRLRFEHRELATLCQIDYDREMAMVMIGRSGDIEAEIRLWTDVPGQSAEFAIMVSAAVQGQGAGMLLMEVIEQEARRSRLKSVRAEILSANRTMLRLAQKAGYRQCACEEGVVTVQLDLKYAL